MDFWDVSRSLYFFLYGFVCVCLWVLLNRVFFCFYSCLRVFSKVFYCFRWFSSGLLKDFEVFGLLVC